MLPYAKILEYDIEWSWTLSTTLKKGLSKKKKKNLYKRAFFFPLNYYTVPFSRQFFFLENKKVYVFSKDMYIIHKQPILYMILFFSCPTRALIHPPISFLSIQ